MYNIIDLPGNTLLGQIWEVKEGDIVRTNFEKTLTLYYYDENIFTLVSFVAIMFVY